MKSVLLHAGAEADLRDAINYYEGQRAGLGGEFRREFEAALDRVRMNPLVGSIEDNSSVRFRPINRFPYRLAYVDIGQNIWVAAVVHHRRHPHYWTGRSPTDPSA